MTPLPNFVCMHNAHFFTTRKVITSADTRDAQTYRINVSPPPTPVIWRSTLVIAWFTCEGNLHHLMTETLHPILNAVNDTITDDPPLVAIVSSYGLKTWNAGDRGCHGATFYPLFAAFNIDPVLFSFGGKIKDSTPRQNVYPGPTERWNMNNTYCFRETKQVSDNAYSASLSQKLLSWAGCDTSSKKYEFRVVIVQRQESRRILNIDELVLAAKNITNQSVSVTVLENMTMQEQVREMACGNVIVAGAQGAGLQWTTLWAGHRCALIEWGWRNWSSYYTGRIGRDTHSIFREISDDNIYDTCPVPRTGDCCCPSTTCRPDGKPCPWPTKNVDVVVNLTSWKQDLADMIAFIVGPAY